MSVEVHTFKKIRDLTEKERLQVCDKHKDCSTCPCLLAHPDINDTTCTFVAKVEVEVDD